MLKNYKLEDLYQLEKTTEIKNKTKESSTIIKEKKELYGEVPTPFRFVEKILSIIPAHAYGNPTLKWLDPGAGTGNFSIILYFKLMKGLEAIFPIVEERSAHIIKNMIYIVELRPENIIILRNLFGLNANVYECDFLAFEPLNPFDVIIGNPPFNYNGLKKVPTNSTEKKTQVGNTVWTHFVKKSIALLKPETGLLCIFIPSIWLKPDKEKMYECLTQYDIQYLNCISNTETNRIFKGNAQTPSCYFLLTKRLSTGTIRMFDTDQNKYIEYYLFKNEPIPVFGQAIIQKLQKYCIKPTATGLKCNTIEVIKTNMPSKKVKISADKTDEYKYENISTCRLKKDNVSPELIINYSNKPLAFAGIPKLVLAHKMYGFPYLDLSGQYGISTRDSYVILKETPEELRMCQRFLSTKTALYLFEATRYRMKYLERYAFDLCPDITRIPDFYNKINKINKINIKNEINDETIADYFGLDEADRQHIQNLHSKNYNFFLFT